MKEANPTDYYPKWVGWSHSDHSCCPTNYQSELIDPSLESCDSRLQEKSTLQSLGQPTMEGASLEVGQTLISSPSRCFSQSARPVARLGFGGVDVFLKPHYPLFLPVLPGKPCSSSFQWR